MIIITDNWYDSLGVAAQTYAGLKTFHIEYRKTKAILNVYFICDAIHELEFILVQYRKRKIIYL